MSTDFWAGYLSGAAGIVIGNPLDLIKLSTKVGQVKLTGERIKGAAAPILGYGALNALLFVSYNHALPLLDPAVVDPTNPINASLFKIWSAGAFGGIATWIISAPIELIKCKTQLSGESKSSWNTAQAVWRQCGLRGFYLGGGVTSIRDAFGYGFYFWSYELSKRWMSIDDVSKGQAATRVIFCGGLAGVITWASIFPLDVVKTRVQTQIGTAVLEREPLLSVSDSTGRVGGIMRKSAIELAVNMYREEGPGVFLRGLGVCSVRAFIVNAVQWAVYEWAMRALKPTRFHQDDPQVRG